MSSVQRERYLEILLDAVETRDDLTSPSAVELLNRVEAQLDVVEAGTPVLELAPPPPLLEPLAPPPFEDVERHLAEVNGPAEVEAVRIDLREWATDVDEQPELGQNADEVSEPPASPEYSPYGPLPAGSRARGREVERRVLAELEAAGEPRSQSDLARRVGAATETVARICKAHPSVERMPGGGIKAPGEVHGRPSPAWRLDADRDGADTEAGPASSPADEADLPEDAGPPSEFDGPDEDPAEDDDDSIRPSDRPLAMSPIPVSRRVSRSLERAAAEAAVREADVVPPPQGRVWDALVYYGSQSVQEVANRLGEHAAIVAGELSTLERRGHVEKLHGKYRRLHA